MEDQPWTVRKALAMRQNEMYDGVYVLRMIAVTVTT